MGGEIGVIRVADERVFEWGEKGEELGGGTFEQEKDVRERRARLEAVKYTRTCLNECYCGSPQN